MRLFIAALLLCFSSTIFAQPMPEFTCQSVGVASCATPSGYCMEFFEYEGSDPEFWENMCAQSQGTFSGGPCVMTDVVMTCLNTGNMMMPIWRFHRDLDLQVAQMMCGAMGGSICPR